MGHIVSPVVVSGGTMQYHQIIVDILRERGFEVNVPPQPQILPAFGAALLGYDLYHKKQAKSSNVLLKTETVTGKT